MYFWSFCKSSILIGILFTQLQSIAQLCSSKESRAREMKLIRFDTTATESLLDNQIFWYVGQQIQVRFINGTPVQQAQVLTLAKEWE
jgi:hypothetical protein